MGCTKLGHIHQWPTTGTLVVQRCEVRCNFCEGEAARKDWKYAWFLRRHVRAIHVKKGQYPHLKVDMGWDARNPRGTVKHGIKKEDSDSDDNGREPQHYIAQPLYEEQKDQGMFYHPAYVNPGDLKLEEGADFDFNDFPPFPSFGTEEPVFPMDMSYNVNNFETFLDDATGGYGMIPNGTRHGAVELDADGIPIINDNELPEGVVAQQGDNDAEVPSINGHVDYNAFFMSDYSNASSSPASSEDIPLSKRPIADILENGVYVEDDTRQRVLAYLCMARDQMADQGIDNKQFISCIGQYARILAKTLDSDVKPTIDAEGLALEPNPATLS